MKDDLSAAYRRGEAPGIRRAELNSISSRFGLTLSASQLCRLDDDRREALLRGGLVEFGEGALSKLVYAFCDSPYIFHDDYADTLSQLQDSFYRFRGEAAPAVTDDEIIAAMKDVFNGAAGGSCDYFDALSLGALLSEGGGYRE